MRSVYWQVPWWCAVVFIGLGHTLHWAGEKISLSAPWWAWGLAGMAAVVVFIVIQVGDHISERLLSFREKIVVDVDRVQHSVDRVEREIKRPDRT